MGKRREVRSVFGTKLFCYKIQNRREIVLGRKLFSYGKNNRSTKRFWKKIVFLWVRKEKCEAFFEQNCSVTGKKREVRSVFGIRLFCFGKEKRRAKRFWNKIVLL